GSWHEEALVLAPLISRAHLVCYEVFAPRPGRGHELYAAGLEMPSASDLDEVERLLRRRACDVTRGGALALAAHRKEPGFQFLGQGADGAFVAEVRRWDPAIGL